MNPEDANHVAATKNPPNSPRRPTPGRRSSTLTATIEPITRAARITSNAQFQGLAVSPKWTNPKPSTTELPSATAVSAAIGPTGPHGGARTTPTTHPRVKRHRSERLSIRSNSPSIAWPQSTRSARSSPTAHCNNLSGTSPRTVCGSGGGCSRLHSTAPAPASSKIARTEGRPLPISSKIAGAEVTRPRSSPSAGAARIVRFELLRESPRTPAPSG